MKNFVDGQAGAEGVAQKENSLGIGGGEFLDDEVAREDVAVAVDGLADAPVFAVAAEAGGFDIDDVARGITDKMVRRNPHVFGDEAGQAGQAGQVQDATAVNERWQQIKAAEKAHRTTPDEGVPPGLPALLYADKVLDRLHRAGRDVDLDPASADLGERLLALVEEARADGLDPEQALRDAVRRRT